MTHTRTFLGLAEAAERYGVTTKTMGRHVRSGRVPAYRIGGLIKLDADEADAALLVRYIPADVA